MRHDVQSCPPCTHNEHALVGRNQSANRIEYRLSCPGSGQRIQNERIAGNDLGHDLLLLGVSVEEEGVGCGRADILGWGSDLNSRVIKFCASRSVPGQGIEHRVCEFNRVDEHARLDVGERGCDKPSLDLEPLDVPEESLESIHHRLRREGAPHRCEAHKRRSIESDMKLLFQRSCKLRVEHGWAHETEFEVTANPSQAHGPQQNGRAEFLVLIRPRGNTDGQMHRVNAARRAELVDLHFNRTRGEPCIAKAELLSKQVLKSGRLSRQESRDAARVRRRHVNSRARTVNKLDQGRDATQTANFLPPAVTLRLGKV